MEGVFVKIEFDAHFSNWVLAFEALVQKYQASGRGSIACLLLRTVHSSVKWSLRYTVRVVSRVGRSVKFRGPEVV